MDRTVKVLLALIAVALWGLLLRSYLSLPAAQAAPQAQSSVGTTAIAIPQNYTDALVIQNGTLYRVSFNGNLRITEKVPLR